MYQPNGTLPEASFVNFLNGLGVQAMMQFGDIPNPSTQERETNPAFARYTVQLLRVLKAKTKGNLSLEESTRLDELLSDCESRLSKLEA